MFERMQQLKSRLKPVWDETHAINRTALFSKDQRVRNYVGQDENLPLLKALHNGHVEMTAILTDAGADPFQNYEMIDMRGKTLFTSYPASVVLSINYYEESLRNSSQLSKKERHLFSDPEYREQLVLYIKKRRAALQKMIDHTDNPESLVLRFERKGGSGEISLSSMLSQIGIMKSEIQKPGVSHEIV